MLLGPDDHTGSHEAHIRDDLVRGKAVTVHEVCADETASAAETGLAVDGDVFPVHGDGCVCEVDELAHEIERRTGAVIEYHVNVGDAEGGEVFGGIEVRIETDDEADVSGVEVLEDVAERCGQRGGEDLVVRRG